MSVLLRASGITKHYSGVLALEGVDFDLRAGEVHALLGENGAGKSTLIKVISGSVAPDGGTMTFLGRPFAPRSPREAHEAGISVIPQTPQLFPDLSVAENIFVGRYPAGGSLRGVEWRGMCRRAESLLAELSCDVGPTTKVASLGAAHSRLVEIARALAAGGRVLALDEPTASLSSREAERVHQVVLGLRSRGVGIIYVSHRLGEIEALADRVTVLRDGRRVATLARGEFDRDTLIRLMVGRSLAGAPRGGGERPSTGAEALRLEGVSVGGRVRDVSLVVHAGEIVGLGGLVGAGRSELLRALAGVERIGGGRAFLFGRPYRPRSVREAERAGVVLVPEDRQGESLLMGSSVAWNISLSKLRGLCVAGFVLARRERALAREWVRRLRVRAPSVNAPMLALSGGNQQKVALAARLASSPRLLLLDEPTHGVDVGAKEEIYGLVRALAAGGVAVLLASSENPELLALCDRVAVMRAGRLVLEGPAARLTQERLLRAALFGDAAPVLEEEG